MRPPDARGQWTVAAAAWTLAVAAGPIASAQPLVRVRAESRIELTTSLRDGRVHVVAVLRDDLGHPLEGRELLLTATTALGDSPRAPARIERRRVVTDAEGAAGFTVDVPAGILRVSAAFLGDLDHEKIEVEREVTPGRAELRLRVRVPDAGRLRLDAQQHAFEVLAESPAGGAGLEVELLDELGRSLGFGVTDDDGRVSFAVPSAELGPPAAGRIVARSAGDGARAEAQTEVPVLRLAPTRLTLTADVEETRAGDTVNLRGVVQDHRGRPLPRAAVGLYADDAHVATVLANDKGEFAAALVLREVAPLVALRARYDADAPWRESAVSAPVHVRVRRVLPKSTVALGLALLGTLGALLALASSGRRNAPRPGVGPTTRPAGLTLGAVRRRTADRFDVSGRVLDARTDEPVEHAAVTLRKRDGRVVARGSSGADGAFALEVEGPAGNEPSEVVLRIEAEGFTEAQHPLVVPHRGEWVDVRVRLESLRALALDAVAVVAREVLPTSAWGVTTPREAAEASARRGPEPLAAAVAVLAAHAERAGFGPVPPTRADVAAVWAARDAALEAERAGTSTTTSPAKESVERKV
jgi:hypothetical protein